jgi:tyrosine-protein kinase Etk/Wzc
VSLHEVINILIRYRRNLISVTVAAIILVFLFLYFVYPVSFRSEVTILPPEQQKDFGGLSSLLGAQDLSNFIGGTGSANSQLFVEMLKSRTAAEYVVRKHSLLDYYHSSSYQEAAAKIGSDLDISLTKEGIIKLNVEVSSSYLPIIFDRLDTLREFSAKLSNSYAEALDIVNRDKLSSKAKNAREYIEQQLVSTKFALDSAETALMEFQRTNKTISLPEQVQAAIDAAAGIRTEIIKTEIEVGMMGSNLREDNKNLLALREKLNELKSQYNKMEMGNQDYLLAFKEVPQLGRQMASLLRDVKIQNEIYLLLQQQYYKEKIQETRDIPTVEILDHAVPPLRASGPRVVFASVMSGLFVFLLLSAIIIANEKKFISFRKKYV